LEVVFIGLVNLAKMIFIIEMGTAFSGLSIYFQIFDQFLNPFGFNDSVFKFRPKWAKVLDSITSIKFKQPC